MHHHPGYARAAADLFVGSETKNSPVHSAHIVAEDTPGFKAWSHNPKTGSIVVQYEPGVMDIDDLLKHIAKKADLDGVVNDVHKKHYRKDVISGFIHAVEDVNKIVSLVTDEKADLRELVPLGLVVVSVVSFILNDKRGRLPTWDSALYRSYRIFLNWHRQEIRSDEEKGRKLDKELAKARKKLEPLNVSEVQ